MDRLLGWLKAECRHTKQESQASKRMQSLSCLFTGCTVCCAANNIRGFNFCDLAHHGCCEVSTHHVRFYKSRLAIPVVMLSVDCVSAPAMDHSHKSNLNSNFLLQTKFSLLSTFWLPALHRYLQDHPTISCIYPSWSGKLLPAYFTLRRCRRDCLRSKQMGKK